MDDERHGIDWWWVSRKAATAALWSALVSVLFLAILFRMFTSGTPGHH